MDKESDSSLIYEEGFRGLAARVPKSHVPMVLCAVYETKHLGTFVLCGIEVISCHGLVLLLLRRS